MDWTLVTITEMATTMKAMIKTLRVAWAIKNFLFDEFERPKADSIWSIKELFSLTVWEAM
jgi:hypothetical protein